MPRARASIGVDAHARGAAGATCTLGAQGASDKGGAGRRDGSGALELARAQGEGATVDGLFEGGRENGPAASPCCSG